MTSDEVGGAIERGARTAVFACGAVEQHGPHLPMFTDAEIGTRLADEVAQRLGNALVAPTVRIGCSEHHMAFAGSLTVRASTLEALVHDYCTSLARHGIRTICIIPSHGGNFGPIRGMVSRLNDAVAPQCRVVAYTDLIAFVRVWRDLVQARTGLGERVGGHADIAESSVMLALHPALIQRERAAAGYPAELTEETARRVISEGLKTVTPNGILGDARGMDADLGEACIAASADLLADFFRNAARVEAAEPPTPRAAP